MSFGKYLVLCMIFAQQVLAVEVKVPVYLTGAMEDPKARKGDFYVYNVEGNFVPQAVTPQKTSNESIEALVSSMIYSYEKNDRTFFFTLFSKEAAAKIKSMPKEEFESMWKVNTAQKNLSIQFFHEINNGMLIGLKSPGHKTLQIHFARKFGKAWAFDKLVMDDNDPKTNNVGLWVSFLPMKINKASLVQTFSRKDKFNILEAQVSEPFVSVLYKTKGRWEVLGQVKDNEDDYSSWPDLNKNKGMVKMDLENFDTTNPDKTEILVLESSFPISFYPLSAEASGQFTY